MLPLVLVLMLLSGLLIVPTLKYASTSLKAKQVTEKKTLELYAADAGVEEALSYLPQLVGNWSDGTPAPPNVGPYAAEKLTGHGSTTKYCYQRDEPLAINDKTVDGVDVTVERNVELQYYNITSKATSTDDAGGSYTTVTSYVEFADFSCLLDKLATSKTVIRGVGAEGIPDDEKVYPYEGSWPTADYLEGYYLDKVDTSVLFPDGHIYVDGARGQGELYRNVEDEDFVIEGASPSEGNILTLNGTVYIKGNLKLGQNGKFTLDLHGQTIFVEGTITTGAQTHIALAGSGCIIAEEAVVFQPGIDIEAGEFVFIMSVNSTVTIQPNPDFTGAIAGAGTVWLKSGTGTYSHANPPDDLIFPSGTDAPITILSWQIS